jgi:hypothetical protein
MNQLTALALAAMIVTAGGAAVVTGIPGTAAAANDEVEDGVVTDAEIDATYDAPSANESTGTVTVTVLEEDGPVANAAIELDGEDVAAEGVTDANGTYTAAMTLSKELTVEAEQDTFTGEVEYGVENDSVVLRSEEYTYAEHDQAEDSDETAEDEDREQAQEHEGGYEEKDEQEKQESEEEDEQDDGGRGPPDDVPRGPPEEVPRGPPEDVPRGPP